MAEQFTSENKEVIYLWLAFDRTQREISNRPYPHEGDESATFDAWMEAFGQHYRAVLRAGEVASAEPSVQYRGIP